MGNTRKRDDKAKAYRPNMKTAWLLVGLLLLLAVCTAAGFQWLSVLSAEKRNAAGQMHEDYLTTTETPCTLVLDVSYDKEPIDLSVTAPDGDVITGDGLGLSIDADGKSMRAEWFTDQSGDWVLRYNRKSNHRIAFDVKQEYAERVTLSETEFVKGKIGEKYYLKVTPLYKDGSDTETKLHCSVTMDETLPGMSRIVYVGELSLNKKNVIELDTEGMPDGEYYLDVSASSGELEIPVEKARLRVTKGETGNG